jgi:hypothetical protein
MNDLDRSPWDWAIRSLLVALVATNIALLILLHTGGPIVGLAFYLFLLTIAFRAEQRDHRPVMVGGLLGLAVHLVEVATAGWPAYPLLLALNIVLPAALAFSAWRADRGLRPPASDK